MLARSIVKKLNKIKKKKIFYFKRNEFSSALKKTILDIAVILRVNSS